MSPQTWSIDRHIPLALIGAILFQSGIFIWWGAALSSRVEALERVALNQPQIRERVSRIEGYLESLAKSAEENESTLKRIERGLSKK